MPWHALAPPLRHGDVPWHLDFDPAERVQTGSFGACLMAKPALVAQCVAAMRDAVSLPVTYRIGNVRAETSIVRDVVLSVGDGAGQRVGD